jgi:ComF family protein
MRGWAAFTADLLLPRRCAACDSWLDLGHPSALCATCWRTMEMPMGVLCARCGVPISAPLLLCATCAARPPAFDLARALGLYLAGPAMLNPLARAVRAVKFQGHRAAARSLGTALGALVPLPADALVVPVPLHPARLRERGYDQAVLLAHACARASGLPLAVRGLVRRRDTPAQARLDASARRTNLTGAFIAPAPIGHATVALVDDVLTTGATADACARALRTAGVERVVVLTVGRTP